MIQPLEGSLVLQHFEINGRAGILSPLFHTLEFEGGLGFRNLGFMVSCPLVGACK